MYRPTKLEDDVIFFTDDEMPEWFVPRFFVEAYYHSPALYPGQVHLCSIEQYDDEYVGQIAIAIARHELLDGYWWVDTDNPRFERMLRAINAAGFGLAVYKDEATAAQYAPAVTQEN